MIGIRIIEQNDCELLFKWTNEKDVRKNSFNTNNIDIKTHTKWFNEKLKDKNCKMFIITNKNQDVGQIRIDITNNIGIINYSIDKNYRGKGIGTEILKLIRNTLKDITLVGRVKKENKASIKAFEKAGYKSIDKKEYLEFISK